ncbi:P2 family phage major capsid protein [Laribacter hongkongensis]|uniref:P2 family phage major capsid protein n=1 Tax=Laribacter hongkongensis TaxID=168471 RepID=UPI0009D75347|nr:P2 family phage major capsid protein [Laribacter hongkongensis]
MRNDTRLQYTQFVTQLARLNSVPSAEKSFTVAPSIQQTLESRIQQSSEFLSRINVIGVPEMAGEKIGLGVTGTIAGRTRTGPGKPRVARSVADLDSHKYQCAKTNFDTAIPYQQLDVWAKFPDFQTRLRDAILKQQALDRIMIGFNGGTDRPARPAARPPPWPHCRRSRSGRSRSTPRGDRAGAG